MSALRLSSPEDPSAAQPSSPLEPDSNPGFTALPVTTLEQVESFGMNLEAMEYVHRPSTLDGIRKVFEIARTGGRKIALRGAGRSYGDASMGRETVGLDLTRMNRILSWDPQGGIIEVEPGVLLRDLWRYCIGDGWWPPVVSGTMFVTMGGALGMNFHGKNNYRMGPVGEHVLDFDLLTAAGELLTCSREANADLFHAAIGGIGMLGCFTRIRIQMKHVESGLLSVDAYATNSIADIMQKFEERGNRADYFVGWIDCFARGKSIGRGLVHEANYLHGSEDPNPAQTLRIENQELPDTIFGILPKSILWRLMGPISNDIGMRLVNWAKYTLSSTIGNHKTVRQSHAAFAFLLDYVPNWKFVYRPHGFIQFQSFVPQETAQDCFNSQLQACQNAKVIPYLGVFKRHRKDEFLLTHSVNGYSLALDIPITSRNKARLEKLTTELTRIVLAANGRFYMAKDSVLDQASARTYLGADSIARFTELKRRCDPQNILQTDMANRLFAGFETS